MSVSSLALKKTVTEYTPIPVTSDVSVLDLFDGLSYTQAVALGGIETSNAGIQFVSDFYSAGSLLSSGESSMSAAAARWHLAAVYIPMQVNLPR